MFRIALPTSLLRHRIQVAVVAGALATVLLAGCAESKPRIETITPRVTGIDWKGVDITFDVAVKNPLPIELRAPGGRYAIEIAAHEIIRADSVPPIAVPRRSTGIVALPARFEYLEVLGLVRDLHDAAEVPYRVSGALTLAAAGMTLEAPFSHDGELPVLRMPTIAIKGLKQGSVAFSGVSVTVSAEIENPNVFAIGASGLQFDLTVADSRVANVRVDMPNSLKAESTSGIELVAEVGGADAIANIVTSPHAADVQVKLRGELETPFGKVPLARE